MSDSKLVERRSLYGRRATDMPSRNGTHGQVRTAHSQLITALGNSCTSAMLVEYPAKTSLFPQGVVADSVFFVDLGLVKMTYVNFDGKEIIVGFRRSGWAVGVTAAILNEPQPAGALTVTHCRLLRISAAEIRGFTSAESMLCRYLHELQGQELRSHLLNVVELASHSTDYRLAKLLYELAFGMYSSQSRPAHNVRIPFKQWEIAELLAITPEHTCRIIRRFEKEGLVFSKGRVLFVRHHDKLLAYLDH